MAINPNDDYRNYLTTDERNAEKDLKIPTMNDATLIASEFSRVLRTWLTPAEIRLATMRNKHEDSPNVCHSHDFCDANMAMAEALDNLGFVNGLEHEEDSYRQPIMDVWNASWDAAKRAGFHPAMDSRMTIIAAHLVKMGVDASVYEPNGPVTCVRVADEDGKIWLFGTGDDNWGASLENVDGFADEDEYLETNCSTSEPDLIKVAQAINLAINPNSGRR